MQQEYKEWAGIPIQNVNNKKLGSKEQERKMGPVKTAKSEGRQGMSLKTTSKNESNVCANTWGEKETSTSHRL